MNPLHQLQEHGQSYWLDNLTRHKIRNGELARRVREEALRGVTSNPVIFHKAISAGSDYDEQIAAGFAAGLSVQAIYEELVTTDVRDACELLHPVWEASGGRDGFVSLEVSPHLAHDAEGSIEEARKLAGLVGKPNLMIKIPGTVEGLTAIEQCLFEGININITLLFSIERYAEVAERYIAALERRMQMGLPLTVASVASFFLSRIDAKVDQLLDQKAAVRRELAALKGRAAVANAKLAYQRFLSIVGESRWMHLIEHGARPQRLLWASTSTKNPDYPDTLYVEPLIGPDTVNTLPDATITAFAEHGRVDDTLGQGIDEARESVSKLRDAGIDLDEVAAVLEDEGIVKFAEPYDALLELIASKR